MAKAIINKHIDNYSGLTEDFFVQDSEKAKGEIIICNNPEDPSIFIMDTNGKATKIAGTNYDDTEIFSIANQNKSDIEKIEELIGVTGESGETIFGAIEEIKTAVDEYTINGKKISENPELTTNDLNIDDSYSNLNHPSENIAHGDNLNTALGKLTVLINNLNLVVASSITNLERRYGMPAKYD